MFSLWRTERRTLERSLRVTRRRTFITLMRWDYFSRPLEEISTLKYEADEEPTPIPSSAAAAQAIETLLLYATGRGDVGILNGSIDIDGYEELMRGRRVSELVQTKISDFALKSPSLQISLDMMD